MEGGFHLSFISLLNMRGRSLGRAELPWPTHAACVLETCCIRHVFHNCRVVLAAYEPDSELLKELRGRAMRNRLSELTL